jgi:phycocyanobilin:ferredoxin oxidoreductase
MHCCVFPHFHNNGPIFGLDIIAGKKKITGFFHDYSPTALRNHYMIDHFCSFVNNFKWNKNRELPDWAKQIFTKHMVAAGNISTENEVEQIIDMCKESMRLYLNNIGLSNHTEKGTLSLDGYNRYASFQKQNPHTPRALKSLGLNPTDVDFFVENCLFPELENDR